MYWVFFEETKSFSVKSSFSMPLEIFLSGPAAFLICKIDLPSLQQCQPVGMSRVFEDI
jgi:hypothetical protein